MNVFLNQKIQNLYSLQTEINTHDRDIFNRPIEDIYQYTDKQKHNWIDQTSRTVYQSIADQQQKLTTGQRDIWDS